jgi:polyisoprenoid-binding protein YceI
MCAAVGVVEPGELETRGGGSMESGLRPGTWNIDTIHSQVMVSVWHFNVANLRAKFPGVRGSLEVNAEDPLRSRFRAEIEATSVTTGHPAQEDFMRSEPWLDVERYPLITFESMTIEPRAAAYAVKGQLTLKGVTREIEIPLQFNGVVTDPWGLRAGFTSQFSVNRRNFGIVWDRVFDWGVMAGYELTFTLDIELAYPEPALAQAPR